MQESFRLSFSSYYNHCKIYYKKFLLVPWPYELSPEKGLSLGNHKEFSLEFQIKNDGIDQFGLKKWIPYPYYLIEEYKT